MVVWSRLRLGCLPTSCKYTTLARPRWAAHLGMYSVCRAKALPCVVTILGISYRTLSQKGSLIGEYLQQYLLTRDAVSPIHLLSLF